MLVADQPAYTGKMRNFAIKDPYMGLVCAGLFSHRDSIAKGTSQIWGLFSNNRLFAHICGSHVTF
jgi:hypothetical protein